MIAALFMTPPPITMSNVPGENGLVGADAIRETIRNPRATKAFEKGEGKS